MRKKILGLFILSIAFLMFYSKAWAISNEIELGDPIPGVRLHLKTSTIEKDKDMFKILNKTTGELVYCIEPGIVLENGSFKEYLTYEGLNIDVNEEQWQTLKLLAYYGYGHKGRKNIEWYTVTQFTIWEYLLKGKGEVYFIDGQGKKIDPYREAINELWADVYHDSVVPDFGATEFEIKYDEDLTITDANGVLDEFDINNYYSSQMNVNKEGNTLNISLERPSSYTLYFNREHNETKETVRLFYDGKTQAVMTRGYFPPTVLSIKITKRNPIISAKKVSTRTDVPLSLEGAEYNYYRASNLDYSIATLVTDENGEFMLPESLYMEDYCLVETKAPYGYKLNKKPVCFKADQDKVIELVDDPIMKTIDIEKYLETYKGELALEPLAEFELYNKDTNELVTKFTTNELGKANIELYFGNFILKQTKSSMGYNLMPDYEFTINKKTPDGYNMVLKNPQIVGSLTLYKRDSISEELIFDKAYFKIKNIDTDEYLTVNGSDLFATEKGVLYVPVIPYGNYILEEAITPDGYKLNMEDEELMFSIDKEGIEITLDIYNEKMHGALEIIKVDERSGAALEGVTFGLYDSNNELLGELTTDKDGKILLENLDIGKYYLKELTTLDGYELNTEVIEIEIKDGIKSTVTVNNRLKVQVPKTDNNELIPISCSSCLFLALGLALKKYGQNC